MKTANIYVAKIKGDDFENVISKLLPPVEIHQPPKGTTPDELLHEYLEEYLNGPKAKSYASFKSGAVLIEDGYAYFKFANFFFDYFCKKIIVFDSCDYLYFKIVLK